MARPLTAGERHSIEATLFKAITAGDRTPVQTTVRRTKASRQTVQAIMRGLIAAGFVVAPGRTNARRYAVNRRLLKEITVPLAGLEESELWRANFQSFFDVPGSTSQSLSLFAATEMINNAIDHSDGTIVSVEATRQGEFIRVTITDNGIGIFKRIQDHFHLVDIRHAVLDLTKGKLTTDPSRHSGMGIFFSSRACAQFAIFANGLMLTHFASGRDFLFEATESGVGTYVEMDFPLQSDMTLAQLFEQYSADGSSGFDKTIIPLYLTEMGEEILVSRSQAKRVLARVDRFKEAYIDFTDIALVGQAFADEIFRVFAAAHPDVRLTVTNANADVQKMVLLALVGLKEQSPSAQRARIVQSES